MLLSASQAKRRTCLLCRHLQTTPSKRYVLRQLEKGKQRDIRPNTFPHSPAVVRGNENELRKSTRTGNGAEKGGEWYFSIFYSVT